MLHQPNTNFTKIEIDRKIDLTHFERICWVSCTYKAENVHPLFSWVLLANLSVLFLKHYSVSVWSFFMLRRKQSSRTVIWSCSPNFYKSQTWTIFHKREDKNLHWPKFTDHTSSLKLLRLHAVHSFKVFSSAGSLTLQVVCLYSTPFCSAVTSLHTQSILHPSDKHALLYHCVLQIFADVSYTFFFLPYTWNVNI